MSAVPAAGTAVPRDSRRSRGRLSLVLAAAAIIAAAATFAVLQLKGGDDPAAPTAGKPVLLTGSTLEAVTAAVGHPVYGIKTPAGTRPEVTRGSEGETWVRYLSGDARVGDPRAEYLTIGTYPRSDALAAAQAAAHGDQQRSAKLPDGGVMLWSVERPESVYAASPGSNLLVEVYSPDPEAARDLVAGGAVAPLR